MSLVECVPNFSEGRNKEVVQMIVDSITSVEEIKLLDTEMDENHNRSVVTFVGDKDKVLEAAFRGIKKAAEVIDLNVHRGEHPRFGAADVVPFIPISDVTMDECRELARSLGKRVAEEIGIPVYLYGEAAMEPTRKNLEDIRNKNFQYEQLKEAITLPQWKPDFGPASLGKAGASIIGARDFLIAFNVNLNSEDLEVGKKIARAMRAKDGGLSFVKALAFYLQDKKKVQISMNLTNFRKTPIYRAFELVKLEASRYGISIHESEIVGLTPLEAIVESARFYLQLNGFKTSQILERKMWGE
ncbi:glutamate formimidoyltransferase [Thermoplasmatales archaeon AK]|nr:glutamate formimidoyltransferase [Thermoplasmatales archaeon AK]